MAFDFATLDGRVLGGDQGEGVMIENLNFKFNNTKDGEEEATAEFSGFAKTVLNDRFNPLNGWKELDEPIPVTERVKFVLGAGKNDSNKILFDRLNAALDIQPPLEDGPDVWERFTEDGENSVYKKVVGGRLYFQAKKNPTKPGEKAEEFFYNTVTLAKRVEPKMDAVREKMKKLLAKKNGAGNGVAFDPNG